MSQQALGQFLEHVAAKPVLQQRLRQCSVVEAAQLAVGLGYAVNCGDLMRYESRAFAWQLTDREYEVLARLTRARQHWWQTCWPD